MLITIAARLFFYKLVLASWISGFFSSNIYLYFFKYLCVKRRKVNKLKVNKLKFNKKKIFFKGVFRSINLENINKFNLLWKNVFVITQLLEQQASGKFKNEILINDKKQYIENV